LVKELDLPEDIDDEICESDGVFSIYDDSNLKEKYK